MKGNENKGKIKYKKNKCLKNPHDDIDRPT